MVGVGTTCGKVHAAVAPIIMREGKLINWGKEQAEAHMKAMPGHAAMGEGARWTCADCDGIILKLTPICRVGMPFGMSGVPDFCAKPTPCPTHPKEGAK